MRSPLPSRVLCILGMHRSGTSCLTGSLQEAGLSSGDYPTWNRHNLKGNRETKSIVDLNNAVLAANEGAWDDPPQRVVWSTAHRQTAHALLADHAEEDLFGFKDPRTLLLLDGWKQVYPGIEFVGIFRHPMAVAQSLRNRSGMPLEQGLYLWVQYNRRLLREYKFRPFPLLCFDESEELFQDKIGRTARQLGLNSKSDIGFFDRGLRSADGIGFRGLPWKIARLYSALLQLRL